MTNKIRAAPPLSPEVGEIVEGALGKGGSSDPDVEAADEAAVVGGMDAALIAFPTPAYPEVTLSAGFKLEITAEDPRLAVIAAGEDASIDPAIDAVLKRV